MERYFSVFETSIPQLPKSVENPETINPYGPQRDSPRLILGYDLISWLHQVLLNRPSHDKFKEIMNFLGISIPFCKNKYSKTMEFACQKQAMGRDNDRFLEKTLKQIFKRWQKRWLVVGKNNVFYYEKPEDPAYSIRDNVLFDNDTNFDILHVGRTHVEAMFNLSRRKLKISIDGTVNGLICLSYIVKALMKSPYTKVNRFTSFAPIRDGNDCIFFSDGVGYYKELYAALNSAKHDIMITDWWLSPEFPLLRPIKQDLSFEETRLDFVLLKAAKRGVMVHILIFREFKLGLNTDSEHAEERLESLHPNIRVMRHPNAVISLWSHHEKMCIVDKNRVFMGGLDLCWNRMDGNNHPLFNNDNHTLFPGVDYGNPLRKDIVKGRHYQVSMIAPKDPRMPWHDVAAMLVGKICNDFVVHFSAYWNHVKETNYESETLEVRKRNVIPFDENGEFCVTNPIQDRFIDEDTTPINYLTGQPYNPVVLAFDRARDSSNPNEHPNPFTALGGSSSSKENRENVFEMMRQEFDKQKQFNDALPKIQSYNTMNLEKTYGVSRNKNQQSQFNSMNSYDIPNPYHPQPGTMAYSPYGPNPAIGQPPHISANVYNGLMAKVHHHPQTSKRNPFEIFSAKRNADGSYQDFNIFMRQNLDQDSSAWNDWMKNNPGSISSGNLEKEKLLGKVLSAVTNLSNHKKIVKVNRFLQDKDEHSNFL